MRGIKEIYRLAHYTVSSVFLKHQHIIRRPSQSIIDETAKHESSPFIRPFIDLLHQGPVSSSLKRGQPDTFSAITLTKPASSAIFFASARE